MWPSATSRSSSRTPTRIHGFARPSDHQRPQGPGYAPHCEPSQSRSDTTAQAERLVEGTRFESEASDYWPRLRVNAQRRTSPHQADPPSLIQDRPTVSPCCPCRAPVAGVGLLGRLMRQATRANRRGASKQGTKFCKCTFNKLKRVIPPVKRSLYLQAKFQSGNSTRDARRLRRPYFKSFGMQLRSQLPYRTIKRPHILRLCQIARKSPVEADALLPGLCKKGCLVALPFSFQFQQRFVPLYPGGGPRRNRLSGAGRKCVWEVRRAYVSAITAICRWGWKHRGTIRNLADSGHTITFPHGSPRAVQIIGAA